MHKFLCVFVCVCLWLRLMRMFVLLLSFVHRKKKTKKNNKLQFLTMCLCVDRFFFPSLSYLPSDALNYSLFMYICYYISFHCSLRFSLVSSNVVLIFILKFFKCCHRHRNFVTRFLTSKRLTYPHLKIGLI